MLCRRLSPQAAAESTRHNSAVSGLVQNVEDGLEQLTAASEEAGVAALQAAEPAAGDCEDGGDGSGGVEGGQDVDMADGDGGQVGAVAVMGPDVVGISLSSHSISSSARVWAIQSDCMTRGSH